MMVVALVIGGALVLALGLPPNATAETASQDAGPATTQDGLTVQRFGQGYCDEPSTSLPFLSSPFGLAGLPQRFHSMCVAPPLGPVFSCEGFRTNLARHSNEQVPRYGRFEVAFDVTNTIATHPYFPYDPEPPPGVEPANGISVDALLLPPGEVEWARARVLPCFYYQPVAEIGRGDDITLHPLGAPEWRCRFTPDVVGTWRYKVRATDAGGTAESAEAVFECTDSDRKGFIGISETDARFFEFDDGTPFVTPLINVEQGNPFNTLADIRKHVRKMGEHGIRFVRWFPTGEGANYFVAPYGDTMAINWRFGGGWITAEGADAGAGNLFGFRPYYYSAQTVTLLPRSRYRLSFRAKVTGEQVLRAQIGDLAGGTIDICSSSGTVHAQNGQACTYRSDGWRDYEMIVEAPNSYVIPVEVALRGLYVSHDAPAPYDIELDGTVYVHSMRLQRDETGEGGWGGNWLTRSDPDTHTYVDQQAAARLDEIFRLSELRGVYHKLPLFHKNGAVLARVRPDGTVGVWDVNNFYSDEGLAARWYQRAYARYFIARWSYSPALHSLELANETHFDAAAQDAAFAIAQYVHATSPRPILMSNSFWGWWVESFWTDPDRGHLIDYSDKHWYANERGAGCDSGGESCELISNVWDDAAAYVRECTRRFDVYREAFGYDKPIVRGEGGVAEATTHPQHPDIARDAEGTYYHTKLWAHLGILGDTCDGEWYPRLFVDEDGAAFPNADRDLYPMFAAYERFLAGERLSSGTWVEIGTDLAGGRGITVTNEVGDLRAWGVQDTASGRTLLWIDNAAHTWRAVVEGAPVPPASGTLTIHSLEPGKTYVVQWWDPYATGAMQPVFKRETLGPVKADSLGTLIIEDLEKDVALKVIEVAP